MLFLCLLSVTLSSVSLINCSANNQYPILQDDNASNNKNNDTSLISIDTSSPPKTNSLALETTAFISTSALAGTMSSIFADKICPATILERALIGTSAGGYALCLKNSYALWKLNKNKSPNNSMTTINSQELSRANKGLITGLAILGVSLPAGWFIYNAHHEHHS